jgi:2-aminoethylphosphonate-pyruvate transaminase
LAIDPHSEEAAAPLLLTPGPLTTRRATRQAMLRDFGSRDGVFIDLTAELRRRLLAVANGTESHVAVPLQGSGTFIVEATIATLVGPDDKLLVLVNVAYGERMTAIAPRLKRPVEILSWPEDQPVSPVGVAEALDADPGITHVALVHCETTTGLLNPLAEIAAIVAGSGRKLLVDAMSSFGALPIDLRQLPIAALMASSNKCLEGVPGLGFALVEKTVLAGARGVCPSLSLDLSEQWRGFEANGQWRFTPPVQVVAGPGGSTSAAGGRGRRRGALQPLSGEFRRPVGRDARAGLPSVPRCGGAGADHRRLPLPARAMVSVRTVLSRLAARGFLIYPGKLSQAESFRIGGIGAIEPADFRQLRMAIGEVVGEMKDMGLAEGRT